MTISEYKCSVPIFCICLHAPLITICNAFFFTFFVKQPGFKMEKKIIIIIIIKHHVSQLIENKVKYKKLDIRFLFTISLGKLLYTPNAPPT